MTRDDAMRRLGAVYVGMHVSYQTSDPKIVVAGEIIEIDQTPGRGHVVRVLFDEFLDETVDAIDLVADHEVTRTSLLDACGKHLRLSTSEAL